MHREFWWEDNVKMDLREIGSGPVDWIYLAQGRDQWHGNEPSGSIKCKFLSS
jgi:hypothetical protein